MKKGDWRTQNYTTKELGPNDVSIIGASQITTSGKRLGSRPAGSTGCGIPVHFNRSLHKTAFRGAANPKGTARQTVQIALAHALTQGSTDYLICDKTKEHGLCNACTATLVSPLTHPRSPPAPFHPFRTCKEKFQKIDFPSDCRTAAALRWAGLRRKT